MSTLVIALEDISAWIKFLPLEDFKVNMSVYIDLIGSAA